MSIKKQDYTKTLVTCNAVSCQACPVQKDVICHFTIKLLAHFFLIILPVFLLGGYAILQSGWVPLMIWIAMILGNTVFIEIRVMCSHCPHYAENGASLQCWAKYGAPRLWKYHPGPMSKMETFIFWAGLAAMLLYPIVFIMLNTWWFGFLFYFLLIIGAYMTLSELMCNRCSNFACPLNTTPAEIRNKFFERNPVIAEAWQPYIDLSK